MMISRRAALMALGLVVAGLAHAAAPDWQPQSYASPDNVLYFYRAGVDTLITDGRFRAWPVGSDSSLQKNQWDGTYVAAAKGTKFALSRNGVKLRDGWYYTKRIAGVDSLFGMYYLHGDQVAVAAVDDTSLASNAVTAAKIASDAVTSAKIPADAIGSSEIAADAVGNSEIADSITLTGTTTADGVSLPDSSQVLAINARLDLGDAVLKFFTTTVGGGTSQVFTWTGIGESWYFVPFWATSPSTVRALYAGYYDVNQIEIRLVSGGADGTVGVIAIRPTY